MTEIEQKALKLLNEVNADRGEGICSDIWRLFPSHEAICRAIEQHEAFKQEVSDAVVETEEKYGAVIRDNFSQFIIPKPKPDPLVEVLDDISGASLVDADELRAALEARGLEIRKKGQ